MTTFTTRETTRDALVVLFVATGKWDSVLGYQPATFNKRATILTIRSGGTDQSMESFDVNPTSYSYIFKNYVQTDDTASWTSDNAEDKLDELDQTFRQVIRDNQGAISGVDWMNFQAGSSITGYAIIDGKEYRTEEWTVLARMAKGS